MAYVYDKNGTAFEIDADGRINDGTYFYGRHYNANGEADFIRLSPMPHVSLDEPKVEQVTEPVTEITPEVKVEKKSSKKSTPVVDAPVVEETVEINQAVVTEEVKVDEEVVAE